MDGSYYLLRKLFLRKEELVQALTSPEFYVELFLIGVALILAWLVAQLVQGRIRAHLRAHPLKRIDPEFVTKPLKLLAPILALLYLSVVRPLADTYGTGFDLVGAVMQLCVAYMLAKAALLVLRTPLIAWLLAVTIMVIALLEVTGFTRSTTTYLNSMSIDVGQFHLSVLGLIRGLVILIVVFWIAGVLSRTLESYLRRSSRLSYNARELTVKFFRIFVYFVALLITLSAMGVDLTAFAVFGGALGVGIGLGLQKITSNFVSGITMLMEKSIQMDDLLEIGDVTGRVRQLNIRYTLLETADGREVLIPNEELMSTRVINWTHTHNLGRVDIAVGVAYGSDPRQVCELMLQAAREHPRSLKRKGYEPACYLREFADSSLNFLLMFWVEDVRDGRYGPQSDVMMAILGKFAAAGIDIPFPQRVVTMLPAKGTA